MKMFRINVSIPVSESQTGRRTADGYHGERLDQTSVGAAFQG
jgi:hypothetical protein